MLWYPYSENVPELALQRHLLIYSTLETADLGCQVVPFEQTFFTNFMNYNPKSYQLQLNLNNCEFLVAHRLTTEKVREFLEIVAQEKLSAQEIRTRARNGKLKVGYPSGTLQIVPSEQTKSGKLWHWDIVLSPYQWKTPFPHPN